MKLTSRLAAFALIAPVLWAWIGQHCGPGWRLAPAVVAFAIYSMNLTAIGERLTRQRGSWFKADVVLFHLNALGVFAAFYAIAEPIATAWMPAKALLLTPPAGVSSAVPLTMLRPLR